jgi:hypothetical protein
MICSSNNFLHINPSSASHKDITGHHQVHFPHEMSNKLSNQKQETSHIQLK